MKELELRRPIGLIYRRDACLPPAAQCFIARLKKSARHFAPTG